MLGATILRDFASLLWANFGQKNEKPSENMGIRTMLFGR